MKKVGWRINNLSEIPAELPERHKKKIAQEFQKKGAEELRQTVAAETKPKIPRKKTDKPIPTDYERPAVCFSEERPEKRVRFFIAGQPIGAVRQTQADKYYYRERVARYRQWSTSAKIQAPPDLPQNPNGYILRVKIAMPKSWDKKKRAAMYGQPHRNKPDADNLEKAFMDALFKHDQVIWQPQCFKWWCEWGEEGIDVEIW